MASTTSGHAPAERGDRPTRAVAAATIGTALEWFDFSLYGRSPSRPSCATRDPRWPTRANLLAGATLPAMAVRLMKTFDGSLLAVVAVVGCWNALSLAMILVGPETRTNDLERVDAPQALPA